MADIWYVRHVRINSQGYDSSGSYWGTGAPLFECFCDKESLHLRAHSRGNAIEQLMTRPVWRNGDNPRIAKPESDRKLPRRRNGDSMFYNKRGFLTSYALSCGYVEIRGDDESGVRLERLSSGVYRVYGTGRWIRGEGESFHETLGAARRAFMAFDHVSLSRSIAGSR